MAFQNAGVPQSKSVFQRRPAGMQQINMSRTHGISASKAKPDDSRPAEDVYAQEIEDSKQWAKSEECGLIFHWNGTFWEEVSEEKCQTSALRWLRENFPGQASDRKAAACYRTARLTIQHLSATEGSRCIIPCKDGWLELKNDVFIRVVPDQSLGVTYAINATLGNMPIGAEYQTKPIQPGLFADYLNSSLPDLEVRTMVQEYIGYTLIPSGFMNIQVAMIFIGNGGDGKGVLTGLTRRLHRKTCAMNLKSLDGFGSEGLVGATLALVDEGPSRGVIDDERIKTMISGDALDINRKHKAVMTYSPVAKWIISANDTPRFGSVGQAIDRRFLFAPWTASLTNQKRIPNLEAHIASSEMTLVLDWALAGALSLLQRGHFSIPDSSASLKKSALKSMDTVLGWKDEAEPTYVPGIWNGKDEIYQDYVEWCRRQGQGPQRAESFWKRLRTHLGLPDEKINGPRISVNGKRSLTVRLLIYSTGSPQPIQPRGRIDHA